MMANPAVGAIVVVWIVGTYAILHGALLVALGLRLRGGGNLIIMQLRIRRENAEAFTEVLKCNQHN
jgi:uncharacterized membrane protein HdeD (DUF308 family)